MTPLYDDAELAAVELARLALAVDDGQAPATAMRAALDPFMQQHGPGGVDALVVALARQSAAMFGAVAEHQKRPVSEVLERLEMHLLRLQSPDRDSGRGYSSNMGGDPGRPSRSGPSGRRLLVCDPRNESTFGDGMTEKAPTGTRGPGRRLWQSVMKDYELDDHERVLLVEAVRTVDLLDHLDAEVRRDGPMVHSPQGRKAHPAAVEARQQRIALARLLAALRLPAGEDGDQQTSARPSRRVGVRGVYAIRGAAS